MFDVKQFGAKGDGVAIDSPAVNKAIDAASAAGGGMVLFPAGNYACFTLRMKNGVTLKLEAGATIVAAEGAQYDAAEPKDTFSQYQDFGHGHFRNSLIWGEGLHDIGIVGPGRIWGKGLSRGHNEPPKAEDPGVGNKAIALKNCHNVVLRGFEILKGGHFGILATGVDNLTIDGLMIDTDRDGMDIDCCRNVRISKCSVNSPWDDGICLKSSMALGELRACENITIDDCFVTGGYVMGTMLDGTWKIWGSDVKVNPTGRIKFGTESNGGFKNIAISNCVFEKCHGLAIESADGAVIEDVAVTNITMREINNTPIFIRLGARMRAPKEVPVGSLKRVLIRNVVSSGSSSQYGGAGLILGMPGHAVEDVKISQCYFGHVGKGTAAMAAHAPDELETVYPEPNRWGDSPASGFYVRHVKNLELSNLEIVAAAPDARPALVLNDVDDVDIFRLRTPKGISPVIAMEKVKDVRVFAATQVKDATIDTEEKRVL